MLRFAIYDWDKEQSNDTYDQDDLGTVECTLADVVRARGNKFEKGLSPYRRSPGETKKEDASGEMNQLFKI